MFAIHGTIVQAGEEFGQAEVTPDMYIVVEKESGKIVSIGAEKPGPEVPVTEVPKDGFVMPGLVDAHLHAPQYAFSGIGTNRPLLEWLNEFTFPFEARCAELEWARRVYSAVVARTLRAGTTTAVYFATLHSAASLELARICDERGQRAFVGRVSMDRNSPDFYVEASTEAAVADETRFVEAMLARGSALVAPIVTPRFVPTCTPELMAALGRLAAAHGLLVQSHVSENCSEIAWVRELHPECASYTDTYAHYGLLGAGTLLAHGVHLTDAELAQLAAARSTVVHCPLSNFSLTSGVCPLRRLLAAHVRVALGTDVCGGASPSVLDAMKQAIVASQVAYIRAQEAGAGADAPAPAPIGWREALYLATRAGADAVGLGSTVGHLAPGMQFDALVVDPHAQDGCFDLFGWESPEQVAEKFIIAGDDRNISTVFVHGRKVFEK